MSKKKANSYFGQRMTALGVDPEQPYGLLPNPNSHLNPEPNSVHIFSETEQGDIHIHYYQLSGAPYVYKEEETKGHKTYKRRRLKNPIGDMKYSSPKGQGLQPYFTESIIWSYHRGEKLETVYFIEGEFKAYLAAKAGLPVVGMGSIHGFYGLKEGEEIEEGTRHFLHPDIAKLLTKCQTKNVIFLTDADTLTVNYKYDKDLYVRQNSFRKAVNNFYQVMQFYSNGENATVQKIIFGHLLTKYNPESKGLDDLLINLPKEKDKIIAELKGLTPETDKPKYAAFYELDANYYSTTERIFGLENVDKFYSKYKAYILNKQFVYRNAKYICDGDNEDVRFISHKDVANYFRLGTNWMKLVRVPNKYGDYDEKIEPWSIAEINRDYPKNKFPGFEDKIKRYDAYCNVPNWSDSYKREHNNCYNLANPLVHKPAPGSIKNTMNFLAHVFSELPEGQKSYHIYKVSDGKETIEHVVECVQEGSQFTVAMDWLTIFYKHPVHMLPVPILVSKEFGTGKSTFLKWLKAIYGTNMAILNNEQFKMRFNAHYITKTLIAIDEGFLDVDKKAEKERLKQMVTSDTNFVEHKGVNLQEFPYFGKVLLCSNDADSVMKMEGEENRWFVVKVPKIKEKDKDPDLEAKMKMEIPAFLYYLKQRQIFHPRKSRLWFEEEHFITNQFKEIVKNTKSRIEKNIDDLICDMFKTYQLATLELPRNWIVKKLNDESKYKCDVQDVKRYIEDVKKCQLGEPSRIRIPKGFRSEDESIPGVSNVEYDSVVSRHYVFRVEDWLDVEYSEKVKKQSSKNDFEQQKLNENDKLPF